jgi:hypothetical protein
MPAAPGIPAPATLMDTVLVQLIGKLNELTQKLGVRSFGGGLQYPSAEAELRAVMASDIMAQMPATVRPATASPYYWTAFTKTRLKAQQALDALAPAAPVAPTMNSLLWATPSASEEVQPLPPTEFVGASEGNTTLWVAGIVGAGLLGLYLLKGKKR